ncbi:MAG: MFS transporter [Bryobacterales bacterium]|nr:MFS transporter [Bryobacterales bacterium]
MFSAWLPQDERARAQSIMWMSARWGGAVTPQLVAWTLLYMTWHQTFYLFAVIGIVWAVAFFWWYRDKPSQHPSINAAELEMLREAEENAVGNAHVPWSGQVSANKDVWLLWAQLFLSSCGAGISTSPGLPDLSRERRGMELSSSAPARGAAATSGRRRAVSASSYLVAYVARVTGDLSLARKWICSISLATAAAGLLDGGRAGWGTPDLTR